MILRTLRGLRIPTLLRALAAVALLFAPACSDDSKVEQPTAAAPAAPILPEAGNDADGDDVEVGAADRLSDSLPEGFQVVDKIPDRVKEDLVLYEGAKILQIADNTEMGVLVVAMTTDDREKVMSTLSTSLQEHSYEVEPFTGLPKGGMLVATKGSRSISYYIETDDQGRTRIEIADLPMQE